MSSFRMAHSSLPSGNNDRLVLNKNLIFLTNFSTGQLYRTSSTLVEQFRSLTRRYSFHLHLLATLANWCEVKYKLVQQVLL